MTIATPELLAEVTTKPTARNLTLLATLISDQAMSFPSGTRAYTIGLDAQAWLDDFRETVKVRNQTPDRTVPVFGPLPAELVELHNELSALVAARLEHSDTLAPTVDPSVSVTLWGTFAGNERTALVTAERALLTAPDATGWLTLVDRTPVRTADAVGTRYVFRVVSA